MLCRIRILKWMSQTLARASFLHRRGIADFETFIHKKSMILRSCTRYGGTFGHFDGLFLVKYTWQVHFKSLQIYNKCPQGLKKCQLWSHYSKCAERWARGKQAWISFNFSLPNLLYLRSVWYWRFLSGFKSPFLIEGHENALKKLLKYIVIFTHSHLLWTDAKLISSYRPFLVGGT